MIQYWLPNSKFKEGSQVAVSLKQLQHLTQDIPDNFPDIAARWYAHTRVVLASPLGDLTARGRRGAIWECCGIDALVFYGVDIKRMCRHLPVHSSDGLYLGDTDLSIEPTKAGGRLTDIHFKTSPRERVGQAAIASQQRKSANAKQRPYSVALLYNLAPGRDTKERKFYGHNLSNIRWEIEHLDKIRLKELTMQSQLPTLDEIIFMANAERYNDLCQFILEQ